MKEDLWMEAEIEHRRNALMIFLSISCFILGAFLSYHVVTKLTAKELARSQSAHEVSLKECKDSSRTAFDMAQVECRSLSKVAADLMKSDRQQIIFEPAIRQCPPCNRKIATGLKQQDGLYEVVF